MTAQEPEQDNVNHSSSSLTQDADKKMMKDLSKAEACLTQDAKKKKIKEKLKAEARKEFKTLLIGSIAMVVSTVSNQAVPRLVGKVIDKSSSSLNTSNNSKFPSLTLVVLGGGLASFLRTTMLKRAQDNISSRLRSDAFRRMLTQHELEWFEDGTNSTVETTKKTVIDNEDQVSSQKEPQKNVEEIKIANTPASILQILDHDINKLSMSLTTTLTSILRSTCSCVFATSHMLSLNPTLLGLSFSIVPVIGTAAIVLNKFVKRVSKKQVENDTLAASFVEERLTNIATVKTSCRENDEADHYNEYQKHSVELGRNVSLAKGAFMGFTFAASSGALFAVIRAGGESVKRGLMSQGELTSFVTYSFMLGLGTSGVIKAMGEFSQGMISAERVYSLMGYNNEEEKFEQKTCGDETVENESVQGITIENVDFTYKSDTDRKTLQNISLRINRGEVVVLVGKNGSGKSTLASLLVGLYRPQSGQIIAEGVDFYSLNRNTQSQLVQIVPQRPSLFNMSIIDNVKYSNPNATDESVKFALTAANCDEFISKLDGGSSYIVGSNGNKLSGGQQSRISLARSLLTKSCLLILDEPTSSLDGEGENAVTKIIQICRNGDANNKKRALLLISHRMASLRLADLIVVLKDGQIAEQGSYSELSGDGSSELWKLMAKMK